MSNFIQAFATQLFLIGVLATATFAQTATFKVLVTDVNQAPLPGAAVSLTANGAVTALTTDGNGVATATMPTGTAITGSAHLAGYGWAKFGRTVGTQFTWAMASLILGAPGSQRSGLAQYREGRGDASLGRDPKNGNVWFNFSVRGRYKLAPLAGATLTFTNTADGSQYNGGASDTATDANGIAKVAVPEGSKLTVTVAAQGFSNYSTTLAPGGSAASRVVRILMR